MFPVIFLFIYQSPGDMCKQLEAETDIASWTENGGLFVGTNAERLAEYKRFAETGKYFGIDARLSWTSFKCDLVFGMCFSQFFLLIG